MGFRSFDEMSMGLPLSFASQTHDLKMKIDPIEKIMSSKSVERLIVIAPKVPTGRASSRCLITDSLPRGTRDSCSGFGAC
jgi:bifunctional pyridoxal-dependent enzyme with beta-cystathionase and maltose regulon repressor activities